MRIVPLAVSLCIAAILLSAPESYAQELSPGNSSNGESSARPPATSSNLPTAVAYSRPTAPQRFVDFGREVMSPYTMIKTVAVAGVMQAENAPPDWGQGASAFADRFGSEYGRFLSETSARYLVAAALGQDAKYYRCGCNSFARRLAHAVKASFTARAGDDGHYVFSPAPIVAPYVGGMTELAWYPRRFGWKDGIRFGSYQSLDDLAGNMVREFFRRKF